jgi:hypothetical protein
MQNNNDEIWKDVVGYEGNYMVSNKGRVKSIKKEITYRYGEAGNFYKRGTDGDYVLSAPLKKGYPVVGLSKSGKVKTMLVHRLVAIAFIPNPEKKPQVNHKDGNRANANVENLEWCTQIENICHSVITGLKAPGEKQMSGEVFLDDNGKHINCRKVVQKDFSGKPIKVWGSVKEAFLGTGIPYISKAARFNISAGGFLWSYQDKSISEKKAEKPARRIIQKDIDGNVITAWESVHQIKSELNYKMKLILDVCRGGMRTAYDFIWEFEKPVPEVETQEQGGFSIIETSE